MNFAICARHVVTLLRCWTQLPQSVCCEAAVSTGVSKAHQTETEPFFSGFMFARGNRRRKGTRNGKPYEVHNQYRMHREIKERVEHSQNAKHMKMEQFKMFATQKLMFKNTMFLEHRLRNSLSGRSMIPNFYHKPKGE